MNLQVLERSDAIDAAIERTDNPTFKMYSGALKAFEREDGRKMLSCTASSSVEDLHGDTMTSSCVQDMGPQAKRKSMVIFLNHSYDVPEDVFGYVADARVVSRATDTDGSAIFDLDLDIVLNEANDRAIATYAAIKDQGVKLGVSIGALITDWKLKDEKAGWWGGLIIEGVNLLEASIVGIPANPRSWVQNAVRALKSILPAGPVVVGEAGEEKFVVGKEITGKLVGVGSMKPEPGEPQQGDIINSEPLTPAEAKTSETKSVETESAPEGESTEDEDDASTEKTEEPTSTVDLDAALEKVNAALEGDDGAVSEFFKTAFVSAMERIESLETELAAAVSAKAEAEANFNEAATIVEMVANLPLGRKAVVSPAIASFQETYRGMYSDNLLALLDSKG